MRGGCVSRARLGLALARREDRLLAETGGWDGRLRLEGCSEASTGVVTEAPGRVPALGLELLLGDLLLDEDHRVADADLPRRPRADPRLPARHVPAILTAIGYVEEDGRFERRRPSGRTRLPGRREDHGLAASRGTGVARGSGGLSRCSTPPRLSSGGRRENDARHDRLLVAKGSRARSAGGGHGAHAGPRNRRSSIGKLDKALDEAARQGLDGRRHKDGVEAHLSLRRVGSQGRPPGGIDGRPEAPTTGASASCSGSSPPPRRRR